MLGGDCSRLCEQIGISDPSSWLYVSAQKLAELPEQPIARLVVHYDIYAQQSEEHGFRHVDGAHSEISQRNDRDTLCFAEGAG